MPELPEVQTTVNGLNRKVTGKKIIAVWTDIAVATPSLPHYHHTTKSAEFFKSFKKMVVGAVIRSSERRGKNIFIHLSNGNTIWIHMKMTGHLIYGAFFYDKKTATWMPDPKQKNKALRDPFNRFLHTVLSFSNGKMLALSDMRKFAKVTLFPTKEMSNVVAAMKLGPEPLEKDFTLSACRMRLNLKPAMAIKLALLDQTVISGIGNIYSDEALWLSGIHPHRKVKDITESEMKKLHNAIRSVLARGIDFGGDSMSDYRDIDGKAGGFQGKHEAYRRTGKSCRKHGCNGVIARIPFGSRNAHFCPIHQR